MNCESPKCPTCNRFAPKLVPLNDNGTGKKVCIYCKREHTKKILGETK